MTKEIILTISGLHSADGESDEPVEIITPGQYYLKNDKHYVLFDEVMEGIDGVLKSRLKISEDQVELQRSGSASARMVFKENHEHQTIYHTPAGQLALSFYTEKILTEIKEEQIDVKIQYLVMADGQVVTESQVHLNICPKELKKFGE